MSRGYTTPMCHTSFLSRCLEGHVDPEDIEDFVAAWHEGEGGDSLPEFLGFTDEEYALWVEKPMALPLILHSKRNSVNLEEAAAALRKVPAAGPLSPEEAAKLLFWLRERRRGVAVSVRTTGNSGPGRHSLRGSPLQRV